MKAFAVIAAATLGLATAANAAPRTAPEPNPAPASVKDVKSDDARRVCIVDDVTGSRFQSRTCYTVAEWKKQGIDPLAAN